MTVRKSKELADFVDAVGEGAAWHKLVLGVLLASNMVWFYMYTASKYYRYS